MNMSRSNKLQRWSRQGEVYFPINIFLTPVHLYFAIYLSTGTEDHTKCQILSLRVESIPFSNVCRHWNGAGGSNRPLWTTANCVWPQDLVKSRSREIWVDTFQSLWNVAETSAATLPRCLSIFRAIWSLYHPISRLRGFTRFVGKTCFRLVNRGPVFVVMT